MRKEFFMAKIRGSNYLLGLDLAEQITNLANL